MVNLTVNYQDTLGTLTAILVFTLVGWYIQYHWRRRRLYAAASKVKGPPTLPLVGNGLHFVFHGNDAFSNSLSLIEGYESPTRIWLGQELVFATWNPTDIELILNSQHALGKNDVYRYVEAVVGTGLFSAPVSKWKRHRKIIMPTFNQQILNTFVEVFSEQSSILLKQLEKEVGNDCFDVFQYLSKYALDIICVTTMGVTVNAQTTDSEYAKNINKSLEIAYERMFNIFYHSDLIFSLNSLAKEMINATKKVHAFTSSVVKEKRRAYQQRLKSRRENPEAEYEEDTFTRKTFLQQLIELSEEGVRFTDEELREEVDTFMAAGTDTTATMSSFVLTMLGMHADIQQKLYEEVINVLGYYREVEWEDLSKFEYLERVIKETMRLFPAGPTISRAVTKDIELEGYTIPEGSSVVVYIIKVHRSENYWKDPLKFNPDRFIPEEVAKRHPYCYVPFSAGLRNCAGLRFGMMSMKALLAKVIRRYRVSTGYRTIEEIKLKADIVIKPVDGFKLLLHYREP